jgi:hypothetical protein
LDGSLNGNVSLTSFTQVMGQFFRFC